MTVEATRREVVEDKAGAEYNEGLEWEEWEVTEKEDEVDPDKGGKVEEEEEEEEEEEVFGVAVALTGLESRDVAK
jgi:hypothetical protein